MKPKQITPKTIQRLMAARPSVPDGKSGSVKVEHRIVKKSENLPVVSMRNAIFMGYKPWQMRCGNDTTIRTMRDQDGVWMTDSPQELWQANLAVSGFKGKVLIGGLGLGVVSTFAANRKQVTYVHTVEINKNVCKLVEPYLSGSKHTVIQTDLWKWLETVKPGQYDCAFFDIWRGTGEWEWTGTVVPLQRLAGPKIKLVRCWQEEEMFTQVAQVLYRAVHFPSDMTVPPHYAVFRDAVKEFGIEKESLADFSKLIEREVENRSDPGINFLVNVFRFPGSRAWELHFGKLWDKYFPKQKGAAA